jgi:hypothetical protein
MCYNVRVYIVAVREVLVMGATIYYLDASSEQLGIMPIEEIAHAAISIWLF